MYGPGVEKISEQVKEAFPKNRVSIFSSDFMKKKVRHNYCLKKLMKIKLTY